MEVQQSSHRQGDRGDRRRDNRDNKKGNDFDAIKDLSIETRQKYLTDKYNAIVEKIQAPSHRAYYRYTEEHTEVNNWEAYWLPHMADNEANAARDMLNTQRERIDGLYNQHHTTSEMYLSSLNNQITPIDTKYKRYQDPSGRKAHTDFAQVLEAWELTAHTHAARDNTQQQEWNTLIGDLAEERGRYVPIIPDYNTSAADGPPTFDEHNGSAPPGYNASPAGQ